MKKINNKGFSLIELIIVIAIMAILVAIIAPNLTKYLGSSKEKTDAKNIDEVIAQVKNCISDATIDGNITVAEGTYYYKNGKCTFNNLTAVNSFGELIEVALDGAKSESKVDPKKKCIKISVTSNGGGFKVTADHVNS